MIMWEESQKVDHFGNGTRKEFTGLFQKIL